MFRSTLLLLSLSTVRSFLAHQTSTSVRSSQSVRPNLRSTLKMSTFANARVAGEVPHNFSWQQTMLRIKDPAKTLDFYRDKMGMRVVHTYDFPQWKFSLYFLASIPPEQTLPEPGTKESEAYLWSMPGTTLELTHNHGTETDPDFPGHHNGNTEPRGFGHVAFNTDDVYGACEALEKAGVQFQKKPDEGRMKGLAFALDPDGYWVEIVKRGEMAREGPGHCWGNTGVGGFDLSQTMMRVRDPTKTLKFYCEDLGMSLLAKKTFSDFSLYFLKTMKPGTPLPADPESAEAWTFAMSQTDGPVLELTHNHGTEIEAQGEAQGEGFKGYDNGNNDPHKGFGHIGFLCDDLDAACSYLENERGVSFKKRPTEGSMRGLAFAYDPDGYWIELIQRGITF